MVKLEEVMDEEFQREQDGPHDDDEWDTDSGMRHPQRALSRATKMQTPHAIFNTTC
jgi:hypothetical protein